MDPAHAHHRRGGGAAGGRDLHGQVEAVIDLVILDVVIVTSTRWKVETSPGMSASTSRFRFL